MVKIRLKRIGKRHEPHFRIVAQDSRYFRSGKVIEEIGYYNPAVSPSELKYDKAILEKWLKQGAQLSDTLHDLFVKEKIVKQDSSRVAQIKAVISASKKRATEEKADTESPKPEAGAQVTKKSEENPQDKGHKEEAAVKDKSDKEVEPENKGKASGEDVQPEAEKDTKKEEKAADSKKG